MSTRSSGELFGVAAHPALLVGSIADGDSDEDHEEDYIEENVSRYQDHLFKFGEFEEVRFAAVCAR